jgi:DNA-binding transcriptional regulator LsrR (DeoR family)
MKKVTDQQKEDVLRLHFVEHLPTRQIAARLGMARRTVRSVITGRQSAPAPAARQPRVTQLSMHEAFIKQELQHVPSMNAPAMYPSGGLRR